MRGNGLTSEAADGLAATLRHKDRKIAALDLGANKLDEGPVRHLKAVGKAFHVSVELGIQR